MKKQIVLSLLIMSPTFMHGMENDPWSLSSLSLRFSAWLSPNQVQHESELISDLRKSKSILKNQVSEGFKLFKFYEPNINYDFFTFFHHCYYPKNQYYNDHLNLAPDVLVDRQAFRISLTKNQKGQIDDYSFLGMAMIAKDESFFSKDISIEEKHCSIKELIKLGFTPTPKDIGLAKLIVYDEITIHRKPLLHLLQTHPEVNWSILPPEIRKQIMQYMIQLFWLLPETVYACTTC